MADTDNFTIFLVIGLMILAILLAVFNFGIEPTGQSSGKSTYVMTPVYNISTAFHVGPQRFDAVKTYSFAFDTSNLRESESANMGGKNFSNGVFFDEDVVSYHVSVIQPSSMSIYFEVVKSNGLAPLVIKVNGNVIANQVYEPGKYQLDVSNSLLTSDMDIEIAAASSGWQIWAPNVYELSDITLEVEGYQENAFNYIFSVDENVLNNMKYGKVDVSLAENTGEFGAIINTRDAYLSRPESGFAFSIYKADLMEGENVLAFYGSRDSSFGGTSVITLYYYEERVAELRTPINLTKIDYAGLDHMVIRFNTFRVAHPGGLRIQLENANGISYREFASVHSDGMYEFVVDRREVVEGYNILSITSVDGAIFDVTDLDVEISSKALQ